MVLPCPPNCPKEIYDLTRECWNRQESERPTFREIHMFLQRKNMGYNPADEKLSQIQVPICWESDFLLMEESDMMSIRNLYLNFASDDAE